MGTGYVDTCDVVVWLTRGWRVARDSGSRNIDPRTISRTSSSCSTEQSGWWCLDVGWRKLRMENRHLDLTHLIGLPQSAEKIPKKIAWGADRFPDMRAGLGQPYAVWKAGGAARVKISHLSQQSPS